MIKKLEYFLIANDLNKKHHNLLCEKQLHFRGNFKAFSIVSVSQKFPELGPKRNSFTSIEQGEKGLREACEYFKKLENEGYIAGRKTEEKNLQAFIINHSLNNKGVLPFGDFTFVTSEMAVQLSERKKIVNDILAIDSNNNLAIIELKSLRNNKVKQQTIDFEEKVIIPHSPLIKELVKIITGKTWNEKTRKIAVWNAPTSQKSIRLNSLADKVELYNYVYEGEKTNQYVIMNKVIFSKE